VKQSPKKPIRNMQKACVARCKYFSIPLLCCKPQQSLFAFVLVAIVAWISSASKSAAAIRNQIGLLFSGKIHTRLFGVGTNRYVDWVSHNKHLLEWGVVSVIALTMLLVRLTIKSLILYAFLMLFLILTIEVVGGNAENKIYSSKRLSG
jgi:hypothetical protein